MHSAPDPRVSDRLARFLKRASGFERADVEAIVDRLMSRLEEMDRATDDGRMAA